MIVAPEPPIFCAMPIFASTCVPLHSPRIAKIEVVRRGDARRAKLYYLRKRVGKSRRLRDQRRGLAHIHPEESARSPAEEAAAETPPPAPEAAAPEPVPAEAAAER